MFLMETLALSALVFVLGVWGMFAHRQHAIAMLMCLELTLLSVNMNFVAFSHALHDVQGQVFVFFILTVAAAEAAIGLAIALLWYRARGNIQLNDMTQLKG